MHSRNAKAHEPFNYDSWAVDQAEREGFEPSVPLRVHWFSRPVGNFHNQSEASGVTESGSSVLQAGLQETARQNTDWQSSDGRNDELSDPALRRLFEAWPTLPEPVRATIQMLVASAGAVRESAGAPPARIT